MALPTKRGLREEDIFRSGCRAIHISVPLPNLTLNTRRKNSTLRTKLIKEALENCPELVVWRKATEQVPCEIGVVITVPYPSSVPTWYKEAARYNLVAPLQKDNQLLLDAVTDAVNVFDNYLFERQKQVYKTTATYKYAEEQRLEITLKALQVDFGEIKDIVKRKKREEKLYETNLLYVKE